MHDAAMTFVRSVLEQQSIPHGPIVEIGGRNINGTVRPFFDGRPYASIDLYAGTGVDLVADVCTLSPHRTAQSLFKRPTVSCVVCCEVLEHASDGRGICRWAYRLLAPDGLLIVTAANPERFVHSGIDGGPLHEGEFYRGVSVSLLRTWLREFTRCEIAINGADIYATARKGRAR